VKINVIQLERFLFNKIEEKDLLYSFNQVEVPGSGFQVPLISGCSAFK